MSKESEQSRPRRRRLSLLPRRWWEVLAEAPASELPFARYFAAPRTAQAETAPLPSGRIIEPILSSWGEDPFAREWFEAGEDERLDPICLEADRPPLVRRALTWVRARRHR